MSAKERVRLDAMRRVERDEVTVVSAAVLMCVSLRQARHLRNRFAQGFPAVRFFGRCESQGAMRTGGILPSPAFDAPYDFYAGAGLL